MSVDRTRRNIMEISNSPLDSVVFCTFNFSWIGRCCTNLSTKLKNWLGKIRASILILINEISFVAFSHHVWYFSILWRCAGRFHFNLNMHELFILPKLITHVNPCCTCFSISHNETSCFFYLLLSWQQVLFKLFFM